MTLPHYSRVYMTWIPFLSRVLFAGLFLGSASAKIPGTATFIGEVAMTAAAGVPFAAIAVTLAFILEIVASISLLIGWHARTAAFVLALFTILLTAIFHSSFSSQLEIGTFFEHIGLIAGLLYMSVYGAQTIAVRKDTPVL